MALSKKIIIRNVVIEIKLIILQKLAITHKCGQHYEQNTRTNKKVSKDF